MVMSDAGETSTLEPRGSKLRNPRFVRATVRRTEMIAARMKRITIARDDRLPFPASDPAAKVRLFMPAAGDEAPVFPIWSPAGLRWPAGTRTAMRSYTARRCDAGSPELTVDIFLHGRGPGAAWARSAGAGSRLGLLCPEPGYLPLPGTRLHLLAGDESSLPAIASILASLPAGAQRLVVAETGEPDLRGYLGAERVTWLAREAIPGRALARHVRSLVLPSEHLQAFVAAEATPTRLIREHLSTRYGLGAGAGTLLAKGYWKIGR